MKNRQAKSFMLKGLLAIVAIAAVACNNGGTSSGGGSPSSPTIIGVGGATVATGAYTSSNGSTWTAINAAAGTGTVAFPVANLLGIAYGNGAFVAATLANSYTSLNNGASWTNTAFTASLTTAPIAIAYGSLPTPTFVAVGGGSGNAGIVQFSNNNGTSWQTGSIPAGTTGIQGLAYGNGTFVAVGNLLTANNTVAYSTNGGASFTAATTAALTTNPLVGVAYTQVGGVPTFVAVSITQALTSSGIYTAGTTWNAPVTTAVPLANAVAIAGGNGIFVAVGGTNVYYSTNGGVTWTAATAPTIPFAGLTGVNYAAGMFIAYGTSGVWTSTNGSTWTGAAASATNPLTFVEGGVAANQ